ncbi:N-acetyl-gamma-glutamyl-phosphate reductase [Terrihalobacillus insolitus]|uniref:N-acetyl-gamma-glutamyl-phosphate reductase n=1 Tax=Terrihalobacillus insolitus TaxID=2950438 RepID=UPI002342459E|nr:N-acetyl-gamma-glutamyl-phosphate reductase [Terrihalobacillus insolitus]MDC3414378.1 N-acetyl-gamma-glutamyl-phosphate reductase [Terrihalobacillus insolitus]
MKVAIVGGTGYGSIELIRLLQMHPHVEVSAIVSHSQSESALADIYPHVTGVLNYTLESMDIAKIKESIDLVFFATPSGISMKYAPEFIENGVKCIDLSGDFRLKNLDEYEQWYKGSPAPKTFVESAVYGLSEFYENQIKSASLIANPGCYPTATLLAILPILKLGIIDPNTIVIDGKTGASGAGRGLSLSTHYTELNDNVRAYKIGEHQHTPEMEQTIYTETNQRTKVTFSTHLLPMTRGIMCTIYATLNEPLSTADVLQQYREFYQNQPFVRVRSEGNLPTTKEVYGSNFCDIGVHADDRTGRVTIVSVIDNLVKGASGQAIQNMNIMNGWNQTTGLMQLPVYP